MKAVYSVLLVLLVLASACQTISPPVEDTGTLRLSAMFSDDMVLQRDMATPIWGWAAPGARVWVTRDRESPEEAIADGEGKWMVRLPALPAGGPHTLTVTSETKSITLQNVMMGDVWICSGQSNMQWPVWVKSEKQAMYSQYPIAESASAVYPNIRLYMAPMTTSFDLQEDVPLAESPMYPNNSVEDLRTWRVCSPESVRSFSAVAYFFGREICGDVTVPVGLIQTAWGGTPCESWVSAETLRTHPDYGDRVTTLGADVGRIDALLAEYKTALTAWQETVDTTDAGLEMGKAAWAETELDDTEWAEIELPNIWETEGYPDLDGYVWFRREVQVPPEWAGKDLMLYLTAINDANQTWINGVRISDFTEQSGPQTPRCYAVPGHAVKSGANQITVRVYDMGNKGGFIRNTGFMELRNPKNEGKALSLAGLWKMRIGVELKDLPRYPQEPVALGGNPNVPTVLFNAMISPLIPFGIKGAIWYQGESNADRAYQYRSLFPMMIDDWRAHWGQGDFPFLFVQLANYLERNDEPVEDAWAELREAQLMTLSRPNTGMAVTIDIGDASDIHPKNKQEVGRRLALAARHVAYGEDLVYSGPIYRSMKIEGDTIRLQFDHVGGGLVARGGPLAGFSIAGADGKFIWANARIENDTVVVSCS